MDRYPDAEIRRYGDEAARRPGISGTRAWRWSGVLLLLGAGLGLVWESPGAARTVPYFSETAGLSDVSSPIAVVVPPVVTPPAERPPVDAAVAVVRATRNSLARGTVRFNATSEGVQVRVDIDGLVPGTHVLRVHTSGDCSEPTGLSAGPPYRFRADAPPQGSGWVMELSASDGWHARAAATVSQLPLDGPDSVIGRSVVVHLQRPARDTSGGSVMACGTIGVA